MDGTSWSVDPHFLLARTYFILFIFEFYVLDELEVTFMFRRLPTWVRRESLRNSAPSSIGTESLNKGNRPMSLKTWRENIFCFLRRIRGSREEGRGEGERRERERFALRTA